MKAQVINKTVFCIQKNFVVKRAKSIGEDRILLQLGIAAQKQGNRIKLAFIKRRLVQTRIN